MDQMKTGGPAFPHTVVGDLGQTREIWAGMTLRDYFAAKALGGMMAGSTVTIEGEKVRHIAEISYELADAMLDARGAA